MEQPPFDCVLSFRKPSAQGLGSFVWKENAQDQHDTVDGESGNGPGGNYPERGTFGGVVVPEVCLGAPGFDDQAAHGGNQYGHRIQPQVRARYDGDTHEEKDADEEPIHVAPPGTCPIYIFCGFNSKRPPDIENERDGEEEGAEQDAAVAIPAEGVFQFGKHGGIIA